MPLKDILVQLNDSAEANTRLNLAVQLASQHDAYLTGLYIAPPLPSPCKARKAWYYMSDPTMMSEKSRDEERSHSAMVEQIHAAMRRWERGFAKLADSAKVRNGWIVAEQALSDALTRHARFCDVAVVGQFDADSTQHLGHAAIDQLLHSVGHAVMVIPQRETFRSIGRHIMIAWDRSPVALRAIHNARPFLRAADGIKIVAVNIEPEFQGGIAGSGICEHLARHDINAEPIHIKAKDMRLSDAILSTAKNEGCDLLIMGAYGRSGLRERVLGSVTSTIISEAKLPVLLSH